MEDLESILRVQLLDRTRGDVEELRAALARGDRDLIAHLGHRLHGAAGALGFEALSSLGAQLDRAGDGPAEHVAELIDALDRAITRREEN